MVFENDALVSHIQAADQRIRPFVQETPLEPLYGLTGSSNGSASIYVKLENLQATGSFKLRGVMNKLTMLSELERRQGAVAASTGNHGAALAYAMKRLGGTGLVFVPQTASPSKLRVIESLGANIKIVGKDSVESEAAAREYAKNHGITYISPYNDNDIIAGQGTIACELQRQQSELDAVFVSLGGGGLISGIAAYLNKVSPNTQIIACSPVNSKVMMESVAAGKILELPSKPTFSDGTAGGVEAGALTFDYCSKLIDRFIEVDESDIAEAVSRFIDVRRLLIEGAAGVAIAAFLKTQREWENKNIAIIICGGNVSTKMLKQMLLMTDEDS